MKPIIMTWMVLRDGERVLMGWKKRKFGMGTLNGIGGKVDPGESVEDAAVRETFEEIGVRATTMTKVGTMFFDDLLYDDQRRQVVMHCFVATKWEGEPKETDEMRPEWFEIDELPYDKMLPDDEFWLPRVLAGEMVEGRFKFDDELNILEKAVYSLPSKLLLTLRDSDFGLEDKGGAAEYEVRESARAVLVNEQGEVALIDVPTEGSFKIPGGGVDEGESVHDALLREVVEEVGYEVAEVLGELGMTMEYRRLYGHNNISYGFLCLAGKFVGNNLMEDEAERGFALKWFADIDAAIAAMEAVDISNMVYHAKFYTMRELAFLREAKKLLDAV